MLPAIKPTPPLLVALTLLLSFQWLSAEESPASKEDAIQDWVGEYRGIFVTAPENAEKADIEVNEQATVQITSKSTPFRGTVIFNYNEPTVSINFSPEGAKRDAIVATQDRLYIPASFADPIEFEAIRVKGEFGEDVFEGTITIYQPQFEGDAVVEKVISFRLGRFTKGRG